MIQKDHIYNAKEYQTFNFLNFRGVQNGYHQDFQYLMVSVTFFHEVAMLMQSLCLINCNTLKIF